MSIENDIINEDDIIGDGSIEVKGDAKQQEEIASKTKRIILDYLSENPYHQGPSIDWAKKTGNL